MSFAFVGRGPGLMLSALICALAWPGLGRAEDYFLQPGDVLSVLIVGWTGGEQPVPIETDGTAWFPIIGEMPIAGSTLRQVRERVTDAYSLTSLPTVDGQGVPQLIHPGLVHVGIEEYRPIYVSGTALQPRTVAFRPGLTVRQAFILAGAEIGASGGSAVVRERLDAVLLDLARAYGRIWSLKSLLGTATPQDWDRIMVADSAAVAEIRQLEQSLVEARQAERELQERTIATNIERTELRLNTLIAQKASEEEAWQIDEQMLADVRDLEARGLAPSSRLAEVRRAALSSATRVLELDATIAEVRTDLAELQAQYEALDIVDRSAVWAELSEAISQLHGLQADLASLRGAGAAVGNASRSSVAIVSRAGERLPPVDLGTADLDLQPGDLVQFLSSSGGSQE